MAYLPEPDLAAEQQLHGSQVQSGPHREPGQSAQQLQLLPHRQPDDFSGWVEVLAQQPPVDMFSVEE